MMKKIFLFGIFTILATLSSCTSYLKKLDDGNEIDTRLVGVWYGSEKDKQIEGVEKKWEMKRNNDGTFELFFSFTQNGETFHQKETGNWWIKDGKFFEAHEESGMTDVYTYKILNEDQIQFKSKSISTEMNTDSYEFVDNRKK